MNMQNCGSVYALVFHTDNGDNFYIGSTICKFQKRLNDHLNDLRHGRHSNYLLQNLWNKYGEFEIRILEEWQDIPEKELRLLEQHWIDKTPISRSINLGPAFPSSGFGRKPSTITRTKISQASKRSWADPEYRARTSTAISAAKRGVPLSPEHRAALAAACRTPEHRAKMSKAKKRIPLSPERRAAVIAACRTPESRAKMSKAKKGIPLSPEHRAAKDAACRTPECRAKMSQAHRAWWSLKKAEMQNG
jgi:group I intron endonuclease